jgi:tRNA threonylcarbamoyladenosine biosynthesis protein TsaB
MKILAFETAMQTLTISLYIDGEIQTVIGEKELQHLSSLIPLTEKILSKKGLKIKDIDMLFVCEGPGSFTGIRIGITSVRTISEATGIPVLPVPALPPLVYKQNMPNNIAPILDARAGEIYAGVFEKNDEEIITHIPTGLFTIESFKEEIKKKGLSPEYIYMTEKDLFPTSEEILKYGLYLMSQGEKAKDFAEIHPAYYKKSEAERRLCS